MGIWNVEGKRWRNSEFMNHTNKISKSSYAVSDYKKILIVCLFFLVSLTSCTKETRNNKKYAPDQIQIPSPFEMYPYALEEALEWNPDAFLTSMHIHLYENNIVFSFDSKKYPDQWFYVVFRDYGKEYDLNSKSGEYTGPQEFPFSLDLENIPIDYLEAYRIAYEIGGKHFFSVSSEPDPSIIIRLDQIVPTETLYWGITFTDYNIGMVRVWIDPYTGEIISVDMSESFQDK